MPLDTLYRCANTSRWVIPSQIEFLTLQTKIKLAKDERHWEVGFLREKARELLRANLVCTNAVWLSTANGGKPRALHSQPVTPNLRTAARDKIQAYKIFDIYVVIQFCGHLGDNR